MSKKVRWAIVGCGVISSTHGKAITAAPDAELIATCDIIPERAEKCAETYGAAAWYTDYNEMMKRDDIDVVSICTPSGLHLEVAEAAAKPASVFSEKLSRSLKRIDRMIQVCKDSASNWVAFKCLRIINSLPNHR